MLMSHKDRFKLKSQVIEALKTDEWDFDKTNLLFAEFGLEQVDPSWNGGPYPADIVSTAPDPILVELYALVMGIDVNEVEGAVESSSDHMNWKPGYVRLFLTHSAAHREFVGKVADELAVVGIHGFVAHDTMQHTLPWQSQIEGALRSMQAFVGIIHPEVNTSAWCQQEIGWTLGRRIPHYAVRIGADPVGFIGRDQWPSAVGQTPKQVASIVSTWVSTLPELGPSIVDGLFMALGSAANYYDAEAAAERIAKLSTLTDDQFQRLNKIWWSNDQLYGGVLPSRVMKPFYQASKQAWPPSKPQSDAAVTDDEPF